MSFDMDHAKELRKRASEYKIYTAPGQTGYGVDHSKYREWPAVEEICSKAYPVALEEITRLQAENAKLREALISEYINDIYYGSSYITWRYTEGFDLMTFEERETVAKAKAEAILKELIE